MTDFSSLQLKVNDLKATVAQNSITPAYLGALLDDFIEVIKPISEFNDISNDLSLMRKKVAALTPVLCKDEADLAAKAASDDYAVGQQFYIPESD